MEFQETKKPGGFREWLAMRLVRLAQWIYPKSHAVTSFYMQLLHDQMIHGKSFVRIDPEDIMEETLIDNDFWSESELDRLRRFHSFDERVTGATDTTRGIKNGR